MEVKTQEIIRYIDLRFKEQDLIELRDEIEKVKSIFENYRGGKEAFEKMKKLFEFETVIRQALDQIHR